MSRSLTLQLVLASVALATAAVPSRADHSIADSADQVQPIAVGAIVPSVAVRDIEGDVVDLLAAVGERPTILVVYRGGWCPYCGRHLGKLATAEQELLALGYQIVGLSPDLPVKLREGLDRLRESLGQEVSYRLLSDSTMEASKALGLAFRVDAETLEKLASYGIDLEDASGESHHLLPVPAVFLVAAGGEVRFRHYNPDYTVRIEPDALIAAARAEAAGDTPARR